MFTYAIDYNEEMADVKGAPTRRERIFSATKVELAQAARQLLVDGGPEEVTVRAVANQVGMTAPAIYRYYPSREALLEQVINDLYEELAEHLIAKRDAKKSASTGERLVVTSRAFRRWALDHKPEFGLLFGAPIPGVEVEKDDHDEAHGGAAFGRLWFELFVEIDRLGKAGTWGRPVSKKMQASIDNFTGGFGETVDPGSAMMYLYCWQSLYGAVCTEAFGHMSWAMDDGEELFEGLLARRLADLGLD